MLLTAGGSAGECWPGFSTVVLNSFSFLTLFSYKHKTGLVDMAIKLQHVLLK